jgi:hypothetical protein
VKPTVPISVFDVPPLLRLARSAFADASGESRRALQELGIAAELAPSDPYLRAAWEAARLAAEEEEEE